MKTFKSFIGPVNELETIKLKPKKEQEIIDKTYMAQVKDPGDLEDVGPEEVGPTGVKSGSGKRPADRLDNKQSFGEAESHQSKTTMKHIKLFEEFIEEKKGLWDNVWAKRKRGEKPAKPGDEDYPDEDAWKSAQSKK